jgi:prepilin-type N-terminal cleavage/methylation domain-containing protein/prepilin-type processing-associated H-X9-DG protein
MSRRRAFTLIELLIVVAVIALLIGLLVPGLGVARQWAREVKCRSNLRQIEMGWQIILTDNKGRVPYIHFSQALALGMTSAQIHQDYWVDKMNALYLPPMVYSYNPKSFNACPSVQQTYNPMFYPETANWGYAINGWWSDDGGGQTADHQNWQQLLHPSQYPSFMDPFVYLWGSGHAAATYAPEPKVARGGGAPDWGVGANHAGGARANVAYADGHAQGVPIQEVRDAAMSDGNFTWFENK